MPDFTCVVCGETVSKRKSYSFKDGRACKKHQEVSDANAKKQSRILDERAAEEQRARNRFKDRGHHVPSAPECWGCRVEGIPLRDYYLLLIVAMEKVSIILKEEGKTLNIFQQMDVAKKSVIDSGGPVLIPHKVKRQDARSICRRAGISDPMLVEMTETAVLCSNCSELAGLKYEPPKMSEKQLRSGMMMASAMQPAIHEAAMADIEKGAGKQC